MPMQRDDVYTTSYQRRFDVVTIILLQAVKSMFIRIKNDIFTGERIWYFQK